MALLIISGLLTFLTGVHKIFPISGPYSTDNKMEEWFVGDPINTSLFGTRALFY